MALPYALDPAAQSRLNDCKDRLANLRRERTQVQSHIDAVKKSLPSGSDANTVIATPEFKQLEGLQKDLTNVLTRISSVEQEQSYLLHRAAGVDGIGGSQRESFITDPHAIEEIRMLAENTGQPIGDRILGQYMSRDELLAEWEQRSTMAAAGDVTLPTDQARTSFYGISPQLRRRLTVLDMFNVQAMDVGTFSYLQEAGSLAGAAETAELAIKPSGTLSTTDATCKAQTIAEWLRIARETMADVPMLEQTIRNRLQFSVRARLESQILSGDGTGNNLTGILTSGIGAAASGAGDTCNADLVSRAIVLVEAADAQASGIVMNYVDVAKALRLKAAGSGERLDSDGAFGAVPDTMWGLPLAISNGISAGSCLVGDFNLGATVFLREGFNIRVSDQDQDDFVRGALKLLGELRAGLAIWQLGAWAKVTLAFPN